jgi:hypothetical protein
MSIKVCSKCKKKKSLQEFYNCSNSKTRKRSVCIICTKLYYLLHKEQILKRSKKYYIKNKKKIKVYYLRNKERFNRRKRKFYRKHKEKILKSYKERIKTNLNFRIAERLRGRLNKAIKQKSKKGSAIKDLGCSIEEFKKYIESKFQEGMSWENWGKWHLDHIIPLSKVNLSNRKQLLKVLIYTNYQPLWKEENLSKGNKLVYHG